MTKFFFSLVAGALYKIQLFLDLLCPPVLQINLVAACLQEMAQSLVFLLVKQENF